MQKSNEMDSWNNNYEPCIFTYIELFYTLTKCFGSLVCCFCFLKSKIIEQTRKESRQSISTCI